MKIVLDDTLTYHEPYYYSDAYRPSAEKMALKCLDPSARTSNWKEKSVTVSEKLFRYNIPTKAELYHQNYLTYLSLCYAQHRPIVIAPHLMWYDIMCEIATEVVAHSEAYRSIFTHDPEGKINIIVPGEETEPLRMDAIYDEMVGLIPVDTTLFLPKFSTSTERSRLATLAAFLETCSPYYNYMMLACGFPSIEILGTTEDWEMMLLNLGHLHEEFRKANGPLARWIDQDVAPCIVKIQDALAGNDQIEWLKKIFSDTVCGSGGERVVDGWFAKMMLKQPQGLRKVSNFPSHITKVPYTTLPSGSWNLCFGMFHTDKIPDFSFVQVRKLAQPEMEYAPKVEDHKATS